MPTAAPSPAPFESIGMVYGATAFNLRAAANAGTASTVPCVNAALSLNLSLKLKKMSHTSIACTSVRLCTIFFAQITNTASNFKENTFNFILSFASTF
jgi:hypothetical protein